MSTAVQWETVTEEDVKKLEETYQQKWNAAWAEFENDPHIRLHDVIFEYKLKNAQFLCILHLLKEDNKDNTDLNCLLILKAMEDGLLRNIKNLTARPCDQCKCQE
jgi:hypothetical protein